MKYFLYYGLIGDWIIAQFKARDVFGILIAFCIIVLGAIVCDWILTDLKKKGENLLYIGAVCGYVLTYGLITLAVLCVYCFIISIIEKLEDSETKENKRLRRELLWNKFFALDDEDIENRRKLLWDELFDSDDLMRCLDNHNQQAFRDELNNLFYDELSTYDETEKQIRKWYIYRDYPMEGSERWKELHPDD